MTSRKAEGTNRRLELVLSQQDEQVMNALKVATGAPSLNQTIRNAINFHARTLMNDLRLQKGEQNASQERSSEDAQNARNQVTTASGG